MSVYLHDIPLLEAQARFSQALQEAGLWRVLGVDTLPLDENALGRVLAETVWAKVSSPNYHASAMDGFAVRAAETAGAGPSSPIALQIGPSACYLDTGDPLPAEFDAVIPIENVEALDTEGRLTQAIRNPAVIRIRAAVAPWSQVRPLGEDIIATQMVLPAGHVLRPVDLGAIAAAGQTEIKAARKPRVAILPTGTELVPIGSELTPGAILEYNSLVLAAQIKSMGGEPRRFPILKDDFDRISASVLKAAGDYDLILLNAGSSAGAEDFSAKVIEKLGTVLVHGVAVRPGHPVILGVIARSQATIAKHPVGTQSPTKQEIATPPSVDTAESTPARPTAARNAIVPIIGVPGYPVSAALTIEIFVEPLLAKWLGRPPAELPIETATLTRKVVSPPGDDDYIRVAVGRVGRKLLATPLSRGAGVITSLVRADGLVILPSGTQGVEAGQEVTVHLYRPRSELDRTIFCSGSHDLTLDLLAQFLAGRDRRLTSANVGSQAGLVALARGEAHLAGSHLLDPDTGEYNLPYLAQYLPNVKVQVIALVGREQGLLVRHGNPKSIRTLEDLTRPEVRFVNRQRGAGTRVLLDHHLSLSGIVPEAIIGYNREEYTHLGIAAAVASGRADCGLGIAAAARALELEFVPLFRERYDLIIPFEHAQGELLAPLFDVIVGQAFRDEVMKLPGYDVSMMGKVISEV